MTDKQTEALNLALEAAEVLEKLFKQAEAMNEDMAAGVNVHCQITVADLSKGLYAAPVIREALAEQSAKEKAPQSANCEAPGWINSDHARRDDCTTEQPAQQQEPFGYFKAEPFGWTDCAETDEGAVALFERPAQQEPVAVGSLEALLGRYWDLAYLEGKSGISQGDKANEVLFAIRKLAGKPSQQEPVGWWDDELGFFAEKHFDQLQPIYKSPPQRTWVGLTDEEVDEWTPEIHSVIRAIESKLREKNT